MNWMLFIIMVSVVCFTHHHRIKEKIQGADGKQEVYQPSDCYLFQLHVRLPVPPRARKAGLETHCAPLAQGGGCSEAPAVIRTCCASKIELEKDLP